MPGVQKPHWVPEFLVESALQPVQPALRRQPFDRLDGPSLAPDRKHDTRGHGLIVDQHGAGATFAAIAAGLGPRQADDIAQILDQQLVFGNGILAPSTVEFHT